MSEEEIYPESSRSLESLRHIRLMALLRDMIESEGKVKAADALGVSFRTLARAEQSGRLTVRMSHALERHLLLGGGSAAAQQRERVDALERRVSELEEELRGRVQAVEDGSEGMREEQAREMRQVQRRLARLEAARGIEGASETETAAQAKPAAEPRWREYRELVTLKAEPDEERVYGEATPVVVEWREAREEYEEAVAGGTALDRADARMRVLELEIELIGRHELTLPPRTYPWDRSERRAEVRDREQALDDTRVERNRALLRRWLRRVLTCGLWRE